MARSASCRSCGKTIRPKGSDMSVGAAVRLHYWRAHREVMLPGKPPRPRRARSASRR